MTHDDIRRRLRETDADRLAELWHRADAVRRANVGDAVHLRGLVEVSNRCVRHCAYCGLHASNTDLRRYCMTDDEVLDCARRAVALGYGTVVLQAGEDPALTGPRVAELIRRIKAETPLAVTLSLGERSDDELTRWRDAGADRYLLRFETSNLALFRRLHPPNGAKPGVPLASRQCFSGLRENASTGKMPVAPDEASTGKMPVAPDEASTGKMPVAPDEASTGKMPVAPDAEHPRIAILHRLREMGYEIGSGVMIGLPGQTWDDLARDIALFAELELDMIGCGPYITPASGGDCPAVFDRPQRQQAVGLGGTGETPVAPDTSTGETPVAPDTSTGETPVAPDGNQVPADELTTYKVLALARLVCPRSNIPATTALATLNTADGRELGLQRGANVVMPNVTPTEYRELYEIYPGKACVSETAEACSRCLRGRIASIGRTVGTGRGDSPSYAARQTQPHPI